MAMIVERYDADIAFSFAHSNPATSGANSGVPLLFISPPRANCARDSMASCIDAARARRIDSELCAHACSAASTCRSKICRATRANFATHRGAAGAPLCDPVAALDVIEAGFFPRSKRIRGRALDTR